MSVTVRRRSFKTDSLSAAPCVYVCSRGVGPSNPPLPGVPPRRPSDTHPARAPRARGPAPALRRTAPRPLWASPLFLGAKSTKNTQRLKKLVITLTMCTDTRTRRSEYIHTCFYTPAKPAHACSHSPHVHTQGAAARHVHRTRHDVAPHSCQLLALASLSLASGASRGYVTPLAVSAP